MRKCKTCDGSGEYYVDGVVDPAEPHLRAPVDVATCPDCNGTGEVEELYEEKYT